MATKFADATVLREIGGKPVIIEVILCRNPGRECFYKDDDVDFSCKIENIDTKCNQVYTNFVINGEIQNLPSGCKCFETEQWHVLSVFKNILFAEMSYFNALGFIFVHIAKMRRQTQKQFVLVIQATL